MFNFQAAEPEEFEKYVKARGTRANWMLKK